ncbi:MAG TPA: M1 family metallopeptidase [Rhodanobacteraceae bacterium]|nr:M1 family metallopeptidase [Rhodanobacteraceae bacterium]
MSYSIRTHLPAGLLLLLLPLASLARDVPVAAATSPQPAVATSVALAPIPFAAADAANIRVPSAADAWGGPRTATQPTLSDRVVSYTIKASLDPDKHVVDGQQVMTWRNRSARPVDKIYLHLYLNAFEGPGSTLMTERAVDFGSGHSRGNAALKDGEWGHIDLTKLSQNGQAATWRFVHPDGGPKTDHTVVEVDLPQAVPAGGTLTLDMAFVSQLPRVVIRTGWFGKFHLVAQWFPKIGVLELPGERGATAPRWNVHEFHFHSEFYADYGSFDVSLTVPKGYTVGAVGEQQGEPVANGDKLTYRFTQDDVIDFAWVAAPGYKTLDGSWSHPGSPKVAVRVIYPPEYEASAAPVLKATTDSLTWFSDTLGPYPYRTITAVVPPYNASEAGGMEYPTFFTADGMSKVDPQGLSQFAIDFVTIHEFGHGYFMGILGSNEFEEPWLDEGLNEYWDQRMLRARGQQIHLSTPFLRWLGIKADLKPFVYERISGVVAVDQPADTLDANSWDRYSNMSYGSVYSRTASTMHDLEAQIGKEALEKGFKGYYERWKFRHPSAADFEAALAEYSGKPEAVKRVFQQQVWGLNKVDDSVTSIESDEVLPETGTEVINGKRVEHTEAKVEKAIADTRKAWKEKHPDAKPGTGPYPWRSVVELRRKGAAVPQTIRLTFADGSSETMTWNDDAAWKRIVIERPSRLESAELDPTQQIFLDVNKLDDSRTLKADNAASRRWSADIAALIGTLYSILVTL